MNRAASGSDNAGPRGAPQNCPSGWLGDSAHPRSLWPRSAPAPGRAQPPEGLAEVARASGWAAETPQPSLAPPSPELTLQTAGCGQAEGEESQGDAAVLPAPAR